jgi:hypothetical protein
MGTTPFRILDRSGEMMPAGPKVDTTTYQIADTRSVPHGRGDQTVARRGTAAQIVATQRRRAVRSDHELAPCQARRIIGGVTHAAGPRRQWACARVRRAAAAGENGNPPALPSRRFTS